MVLKSESIFPIAMLLIYMSMTKLLQSRIYPYLQQNNPKKQQQTSAFNLQKTPIMNKSALYVYFQTIFRMVNIAIKNWKAVPFNRAPLASFVTKTM